MDKIVIPLSLGIGLDTKTDPKQVIPTKLLALQNTVLGTGGEFKKRNGFKSLNSISGGNTLASFQDQLVGLDGINLSAYSQKEDQFNLVGKKTSVDISKRIIARRSGNLGEPDMAYAGGYYAFFHTIGVIQIIDAVTGAQVFTTILSGAGADFSVRVSVIGNYFVFTYSNQSTNTLGYVYCDYTNPTSVSAPITLATDYLADYDCVSVNGKLVYVYSNNTGNTGLFYLDTSLVKSTTLYANVASSAIGVFSDPSFNVWVGYVTTNVGVSFDVNYFILNPAINGYVLLPTLIETIAVASASDVPNINGVYQSTDAAFFYEIADPILLYSNNYVKRVRQNSAGSQVTPPSVLLRSVGMYSKPFLQNGLIYMVVGHSSPLQPTFFLVDQNGHACAKFSQDVAADIPNQPMMKSIVQLSATKFTLAYAEYDALNNFGGVVFNQEGVSQMFFDFNDPLVTESLGQNLEISGGLLSMFDGVNAVEHGFNVFPEGISVSPSAVGGFLSTGSYEYSVTYEWTDAQGQLHRSAPSVPIQVTTVSNTSSVQLQLPTLRITDKQDALIVVYRTEVNQDQFFQVTRPPASGTAITNNPAVDFISFTDTLADTAIVGNNQLYTNGGELENIEIPATDVIFQYMNRLIGITSENGLEAWYSKQVVIGSPVEFNDSFIIAIPEKDGKATAGIQMDDKAIFFKYNSIYYMVGQGPSPNGQNNDFTTPQVISTDCGCTNKKSVILMPLGVMFKSTKGIYLLDRSLSVKYIGADVEAYNSATITSVKMIESVNEIRFSLDTGIELIYNYYYNQWDVSAAINAIDSAIFQNLYTYLDPSGSVFQETPGLFMDDTSFIPISLKTAWFSFAKLQGFERAYKMLILGEWKSPHMLQVDFAKNFDPTIIQSVIIDNTTPPSPLNPLQMRVFLEDQKCETYQVTITELQNGPSYGEGLSISSLGFEVGGKRGLFKVPGDKSYG